MAGRGPLPKPASQRRRTNSPTFSPTSRPAGGREGPPPALPGLRRWRKATRDAWAHWWATPQATQWDQSGASLHRWALLYDQLMAGEGPAAALNAQLTALEDRHGFSPAAMAKLRWEVGHEVPDPVAETRPTRRARTSKGGMTVLVGGRGA